MEKKRQLYVADYLILPSRHIDTGAVLVDGEDILAVGGLSSFTLDDHIELIELPGSYLTPGFIDTHIHGAGGFDASSAANSLNPLSAMSTILAERGVTSFFPTVVATPRDEMIANLALLARMITAPMPGAEPCGINIEGPFINPMKRGAQQESAICPIDLGFARELLDAAGPAAKVMTFAPELADSEKLIELLLSRGVKPSMGHSIANEAQTMRAIDAGASYCTHLYNGMPPLHQREMSLAGVALTDNRVTVELIIDGRHINPRMVDLACRCKPTAQLVGISDSTMAAGMPNGVYRIGDTDIEVKDGFSQTPDGTLAGTTTLLDTGWHELVSSGHLNELQAASAVTINPAHAFALEDRGQLLPGRRADLAFFECETNRPLLTVCRGKVVHRASK